MSRAPAPRAFVNGDRAGSFLASLDRGTWMQGRLFLLDKSRRRRALSYEAARLALGLLRTSVSIRSRYARAFVTAFGPLRASGQIISSARARRPRGHR